MPPPQGSSQPSKSSRIHAFFPTDQTLATCTQLLKAVILTAVQSSVSRVASFLLCVLGAHANAIYRVCENLIGNWTISCFLIVLIQ